MTSTTRFGILVAALLSISISDRAWCDTFGSGANTFDIEFVSIGNPGNAADTTGVPDPAGSVSYTYRMGKFEISEQMIDKANTEGNLGIAKDSRGADKPATSTSWNEAARFVNWLNTGSGSTPAYKFAVQPGEVGYNARLNDIQLWTIDDAGYDANNLYRNSLARYFLPSVDEWYKAAYYDPTGGVYYDYPTGSDSEPTPVASGTAAGTAVYDQPFERGPADITLAGGLSPFGTMGQGGNVIEWEERLNNSASSDRELRGGYWSNDSLSMLPTLRVMLGATNEVNHVGFRVASIPEPATPGDFNGNGVVDAADYVVWRKTDGSPEGYNEWRTNFGRTTGAGSLSDAIVPEPTNWILLLPLAILASWNRYPSNCERS